MIAYKEEVGFANLGNLIQAYVSSVRPKKQKLRVAGENTGPGKDFIALAWSQMWSSCSLTRESLAKVSLGTMNSH